MAITLQNPVVQPAQTIPEVTADSVWIKSLTIMAPDPKKPIAVNIVVSPMVSSTGTLINITKNIPIGDFNKLCANDTVMATAMEAVFTAVQKLVNNRNLFSSPVTGSQPVTGNVESGSLGT